MSANKSSTELFGLYSEEPSGYILIPGHVNLKGCFLTP